MKLELRRWHEVTGLRGWPYCVTWIPNGGRVAHRAWIEPRGSEGMRTAFAWCTCTWTGAIHFAYAPCRDELEAHLRAADSELAAEKARDPLWASDPTP
jgi:hypothetical protein